MFSIALLATIGALNGLTFDVPKVTPADVCAEPGLKAVWIEGEPADGKPTKFFAYYGLPEGASAAHPVPGMVLIHGGAGTAYADWVRTWVKRGYAAIAADNCGAIPRRAEGSKRDWAASGTGGPRGWGRTDLADRPPQEQWPYHAAATAIRAHSFLRSLPEVDAERTGVTGVSWGGFLTMLTAGADNRFKFAAPVYASACYEGTNCRLACKDNRQWQQWHALWDPRQYVRKMKMPVVWSASTTDFFFPFDNLQQGFESLPSPPQLAIRVGMQHSHGPIGENIPEIFQLADRVLRGGRAAPCVKAFSVKDGRIRAAFDLKGHQAKGYDLCWTVEQGDWRKRKWEVRRVLSSADEFAADLPAEACAAFVNLVLDEPTGEPCYPESVVSTKAWFCNETVRFGESVQDPLAEGFANPFGKVRTACYWYWLSGHISAEGARKDIAAMAKGGIDRAFMGDVGAGACGQGPVRTFTPAWTNALAAAFDEAAKRDVEIGLFNSPGWSQSGGPWIDADRSMRRFAVRTKVVRVGERADVAVPDCGDLSEYRDVVRLAYPLPEGMGAELVADTNGLFASASPFAARSLTVELAKPPVNGTVTLEAQDASGAWTRVVEKSFARMKTSLNTGFWPNAPVTLTFAAVTSRHFRVSAPQGVTRVVLHAAPNLADVYEKTFAKMLEQPLPRWDDYRWPVEVAEESGLALDPKRVRTVTPDWTPESGTWLVARIGAAPTRVKNAAAVPEATGYETDKMSERHIRYHLASYLKNLIENIPHAKEAVKFAVLDSYEVGGQNYTDDFRARFQAAMGYDPQPYYPAFAGVAVGSREMSDRFLWDVRRFVADSVAYSYVGGLRKTCHELGLRTWLECYGHWGFCGEFLQYGGQSDCVAGEFWSEGELGDIENRAASSCAHIYGKKEVWSESDTCSNRPLARGPVELKERTDRFFAEGVNATLLHLYAHQPDDRAPGILAWFGNEFNRHNTWFEHFDIFTGYLKRCSFMLQQGLDVADIAYFIGEDVPRMTGAADPQPPKGRQYDFINAEVLMRDAFVDEKGRLALPHGTRYEVLVLPKLETMRPAFLEKLTQLVRAGLTVVAPTKPTRSPSLAGWPTADARVKELADALWDRPGGIDSALTLEAALARRGSVADFLVHGDAKLVYSHRRDEATDTDIYFVANQSYQPCKATVSFRISDRMPELWDPQTGERRETLVANLATGRGCPDVAIGLDLAMLESVFVVFRPPVESAADPEPFAVLSSVELPGPWTVSFQSDALHRGPKEPLVVEKPFDLSKSTNDCVRFYSGKIVYRTTFVADEPAACRYLSLGDVQVTAKVRVNGRDAGGVCFAPFRVPVAGLVKKGVNELEVEVCNLWVNRLVGDAALPPEERPTWSARPTYGAQTPLRMSGLIGPVTLDDWRNAVP